MPWSREGQRQRLARKSACWCHALLMCTPDLLPGANRGKHTTAKLRDAIQPAFIYSRALHAFLLCVYAIGGCAMLGHRHHPFLSLPICKAAVRAMQEMRHFTPHCSTTAPPVYCVQLVPCAPHKYALLCQKSSCATLKVASRVCTCWPGPHCSVLHKPPSTRLLSTTHSTRACRCRLLA